MTEASVEHQTDATCWCQPVVTYEDPVTGDRVYVHRATFDGRAIEDDDRPSEPAEGSAD